MRSDVVHYAFYPIFGYFDCFLKLKQHEENGVRVIVGRKSYKKHEIENKSYVSKNIRGNKHTGLQYYSQNHDFIGKIDEAIETDREYTTSKKIF
jgi:hypothetical protein